MVFEIGQPDWSISQIKDMFVEFVEIYQDKPVENNQGGMKAPHAFASYFMLKKLRPSTIIESGVWKGQGTWLFEKACPTAQIISLDIDFSNLVYKSKNAEYIEQDFSYLSVDRFEKEKTICFFDDHQNALTRLQQMKWKGLRKAIFEDNYPTIRGDCYSIKKALSGSGFRPEIQNNIKSKIKSILYNFSSSNQNSKVLENLTHSIELMSSLDLYYEFPPLFKERYTRWGDEWNELDYPTKPEIFDASFQHPLREEAIHYNWMCLVELKK